jgi:His-Xaa-Ser system radical SAM maturase HxsC
MLPLYGTATQIRGFECDQVSNVARFRDITFGPSDAADVALTRTASDIDKAIAAGFNAIAIFDDCKSAVLSDENILPRLIILPHRFDYLSDGDIIGIRPKDGKFRSLYRRTSKHNSFLVTERCNHYCLMCSQPPRDIDDGWLLEEIRAAIPLMDRETKSFAFTGGEPLLDWRGFIECLKDCRDMLPDTAVHVLSNGRAFADSEIVSAWSDIGHKKLSAGIPIYSSIDHIHDYVVQSRGAFDETVLGILKLKDKNQKVEVRVVLHGATAPRIKETCSWIARNLPFIDHVALMGMENTGFALANQDLLWIDPIDYADDLAEGVDVLASAKVNVSVYNLQRCLLKRSVWPYAVQSISDWKNGYVEQCDQCIEKPRCSGFFTSGRPRQSRGVSPILVA